jgi:hypothetical protein
MDNEKSHRKVYAKGYFDGLAAALAIKQGQAMNQSKFNSIHSGLTSIAQKVYEAVPISDPWSVAMLKNELVRTGKSMDTRTLEGCLNSLMRSGLISEPSPGHWIRVKVREKVGASGDSAIEYFTPPPPQEKKQLSTQEAKPNRRPIDILSELSSEVANYGEGLKKLAQKLDSAALEIEGQLEQNSADSVKLKQLQELLGSIASNS